jgi:tRNA (cmo5U34)-methyltransferase
MTGIIYPGKRQFKRAIPSCQGQKPWARHGQRKLAATPCFDNYYDLTTEFLAKNLSEPKRIMDLGAGTGLLSVFWYKYFPNAEFVLVDIADAMLEIAKKRFDNLSNISYIVNDYSEDLPNGDFDVILSALSIHHLNAKQKKDVFSKIHGKLPDDGIFVNYDQFCAGTPQMNTWYNSCWEHELLASGLSERDIERWQERKKLDRECSVLEEISMLQEAGFREVNCVFSQQKFAVICAVK